MSHRITNKDLENLCARLNRITNSPLESYTKSPEGKFKANIGNYHISYAYGGADLHRMNNEGGGVTTPINCGHVPKKELYKLIHAYINGLTEGK